MATKPNGKDWTVKEQIIEDLASGLTIQFAVSDDPAAPMRLRIHGDALPAGNREIIFDCNGEEAGSGTAMAGACRPSWLQEVT